MSIPVMSVANSVISPRANSWSKQQAGKSCAVVHFADSRPPSSWPSWCPHRAASADSPRRSPVAHQVLHERRQQRHGRQQNHADHENEDRPTLKLRSRTAPVDKRLAAGKDMHREHIQRQPADQGLITISILANQSSDSPWSSIIWTAASPRLSSEARQVKGA